MRACRIPAPSPSPRSSGCLASPQRGCWTATPASRQRPRQDPAAWAQGAMPVRPPGARDDDPCEVHVSRRLLEALCPRGQGKTYASRQGVLCGLVWQEVAASTRPRTGLSALRHKVTGAAPPWRGAHGGAGRQAGTTLVAGVTNVAPSQPGGISGDCRAQSHRHSTSPGHPVWSQYFNSPSEV